MKVVVSKKEAPENTGFDAVIDGNNVIYTFEIENDGLYDFQIIKSALLSTIGLTDDVVFVFDNNYSTRLKSRKINGDNQIEIGAKYLKKGTHTLTVKNVNEHVNDTFSAIVVRKNGSAIGGSSYQKYPTQINNGCVYLGTFSNVSLQIEIRVENDFYANSFGVFSVDTKMLESAVNSAIGGDFVVNGDGLSGKIYANDSNSALFTCLPFDKGFSATVNGKSEKVYNVNGFLAVNLSQGENQVKIAFSPQGLTLGIICFCIGVMLFVAYFVFNKKIQKFTKLNQAFYLITLALGVVVIAVIYFVPVAINLIL